VKSRVVAALIATLAAFLGEHFLSIATAQDAPRPSSSTRQTNGAVQQAPALRGTYAGGILNAIDLGPLRESPAPDTSAGGPMRVGVGRAVPADLAARVSSGNLVWRTVGAGEMAAFTVRSIGAAALRVALTVSSLPPGAEIRFFNRTLSPEVFGPYTLDDVRNAQTRGDPGPAGLFWSPVIDGDTAGVEVYVPAAARRAEVQFAVPYVSHLTVSP
jgi:hypothetical protein